MATQRRQPTLTDRTLKVRLSVFCAWLLSQCVRVLPTRIAYRIADRCGDLVYTLFPTYRHNVGSNVAQVLGAGASGELIRTTARQVFRNGARNFVDLLHVPHTSAEGLRASVDVSEESWRHLDQVVADGRGGIIVTAHFGAFDYVGQIFWANGYPLTSLVTRTVPEFIYTGVTYLRESRGARLEQVTPGGLRRVLTALKRGELIGILADRDFFQNGLPVTFFGKETTLPPGPVRMARDTGAPIVASFNRRLKHGHQLVLCEPFYVEKTEDAEEDIRCALQRLAAMFERAIHESPEQWVIFQRVWPERPAQSVRVFPVGSPLEGEILGRGSGEVGPLTGPPESPKDRTGSPQSPEPEPTHQPAVPRE
jgi:KDO2-lipid IV(A) lauroyltransferase